VTEEIEVKVRESDPEQQQIDLIDKYFAEQSPLAQMVEIKGAFMKLLKIYDELNLDLIKVKRRTSNTNSRLTALSDKVRQLTEDLGYLQDSQG